MTLVELLVAMMILGLLMTLVSQAVNQVTQIVRASQASSSALHGRWAAGWSLSNMLANLTAPFETNTPPLTGTSDRIKGFSTLGIDSQSVGVAEFGLSLTRIQPDIGVSSSTGQQPLTELRLDAGGRSNQVVARFDGAAEFAFVNRAGQTLGQWPAGPTVGVDAEVLPRAMLIRNPQSGEVLIWYGFQGETAKQEGPAKPIWEFQK
ncbi:type II secretion system protein [Pelomonas sp. V22]|nr:type II secretion system protein [Pelomonas sp. V22]